MKLQRRFRIVAGAGMAALVLASCGIGETGGSDQVSRSSARLQGDVSNREVGETTYWFEYGPTDGYGSSTPVETIDVATADTPHAVASTASDLVPDTTYHYRLCADDADGHGVCGLDRTVTTKGVDSVSGSGVVIDAFLYISGNVEATSDDDGANPVGEVGTYPGTAYFKLEDRGPVSCLRVEGNRAAIGFVVPPFGTGEPEDVPIPRVAFVEDNGPSGDRWGIITVPEPATTCPDPAAFGFPPFIVGGFDVGSTLRSGDFTVLDG